MTRLLALVAIVFSVLVPAHAQAPYLVTDLYPGPGAWVNSSSPATFRAFGDAVYFSATVEGSGRELWRFSDGAPSLVAEIAPGQSSSNPSAVIDIGGGVLMFRANDIAHGFELWRTDGTTAGTSLVKDIHPSGNGVPNTIRDVFNGKLFFVANDGVHGAEPWVSDGTAAGTQMLLDLDDAPTSSNVTMIVAVGDKLLIFGAGGLWCSDGTAAGTMLIASVTTVAPILPTGIGRIGSTIYFSGTDTAGSGRELWKSDGTPEGTQMLLDIAPGSAHGLPTQPAFVSIGSMIYFGAASDGIGVDLWKSDGTPSGTQFVKTLTEQSSTSIQAMIAIDTLLFFQLDVSIWRSDGTAAGTYGLSVDVLSAGLVSAFGRAYYFRINGTTELWSSDGTTNTFIGTLPPAGGTQFTGGKLYFSANEALYGQEPWISEDGTAATTHRLANINPDPAASADPFSLTAAGSNVFFQANDGFTPMEIWRSDGTPAGTFRLTSLSPEPSTNAPVALLTGWNGALYFQHKLRELWRSNGTVAGTSLVKNFATDPPSGTEPFTTLLAGSRYLFLNGATGSVTRLWRSDGTVSGTILVDPELSSYEHPYALSGGFTELAGRVYVAGGFYSSQAMWVTEGEPGTTKRILNAIPNGYLRDPKAAAGAVFFVATTPASGVELWRTDGVGGSERLVKEIGPAAASSNPEQLTSAGRFLYFVANDGVHGAELWRSDGTEAGTILLADIVAGGASGAPVSLTAAGDLLYFSANDGTHGSELWRSDGTPAGTVMVSDLRPGTASSYPGSLAFANGSLWFSANDGVSGIELWRINGTLPMLVADLEPGTSSSNPAQFVQAGQLLFFAATTSAGRELWAMPLADPVFAIDDIRLAEGTGGTRTARLTVTRSAASGSASVSFATMNGTASSDTDYVAQSGTLAFSPGQTSRFVDIVVQSDSSIEENEAFFVALSAPLGALLAKSVGTAVIDDDDHRAELSIVPIPSVTFDEPEEQRYRITNAGPSAATQLQVRFSQSPGVLRFDWDGRCVGEHPITCTLDTLAPGASVDYWFEFDLNGYVDPNAPAGETVTASVSAAEADSNPADNLTAYMESRDAQLSVPLFLTQGTTATVKYSHRGVYSGVVTVALASSVPGVTVSPAAVTIPSGQQSATFTLTVGTYTGPVKLTATPSPLATTAVVVYAVPANTTPKLDVAIDAPDDGITYGDPAELSVEVAARKHDGTRPTGWVSLRNAAGNLVAQQQLDGNASTTFDLGAELLPGFHEYFARYDGDANFHPLDGARTWVNVASWPTEVDIEMAPLVCAGPRDTNIYVRNTATLDVPTGSVEVTVHGTVVTVPLSPTGKPGEAKAVLQRSFAVPEFYMSVSYQPTGTFHSSLDGIHFLVVPCIPLNVKATATTPASIFVTWTAAAGADHYEVIRSINASNWGSLGTTTATNFVDTNHHTVRGYLYTVRAYDTQNNLIGWGAPDFATTMVFDDDPIVPGVTPIRASHITQIRTGANAMRYHGVNVLSIVTEDPMTPGNLVVAMQLMALRAEIAELRRRLGLPLIVYTDPTLILGMPIRAAHVQELREAVK